MTRVGRDIHSLRVFTYRERKTIILRSRFINVIIIKMKKKNTVSKYNSCKKIQIEIRNNKL